VLNTKFHILAYNLLVFAIAQPQTVARSNTNAACLPILEAYRVRHPLPATHDEIEQHPYYSPEWQDEWRSDSVSRRKQFNLFSSLCEYSSAGQLHGSEMALALYVPATRTSMDVLVTELNALIPHVRPEQSATAEELYEGSPVYGQSTLLSFIPMVVVRIAGIVRTVPQFQFPVGADGHLRWIFRMPDQATQRPAGH
jgi:hypothetical protein